mmetsp:Transcript_13894/g.35912  ORF Transcript_13894/g.35912 Transcript_13894/m.35912 type:complete len:325 (+) Transcript_13894:261-1235(+)
MRLGGLSFYALQPAALGRLMRFVCASYPDRGICLSGSALDFSDVPSLPALFRSPVRRVGNFWPPGRWQYRQATAQRSIGLRNVSASTADAGCPTVGHDADTCSPPWKQTGHGRLELITGPMFAGKTSELIKRAAMAEEDGAMNTVIVKSKIDNRYSADEIVTHDGCRRPCYAVSTLAELRKVLGDKQYQDVQVCRCWRPNISGETLPHSRYLIICCYIQVVAIDEGQFFDDLREYCQAAVDVERKTVLVAGLSGDFRRRPFGQINDLLSLADNVTVLSAQCALCESERPALFTLRVVGDAGIHLVGGADKYIPVCRHHYTTRAL